MSALFQVANKEADWVNMPSHCVNILFGASSVLDALWWALTSNKEIFPLCIYSQMSTHMPLPKICLSSVIQSFSFQIPDQLAKPFTMTHISYIFYHEVTILSIQSGWPSVLFETLLIGRDFPHHPLSWPPLAVAVLELHLRQPPKGLRVALPEVGRVNPSSLSGYVSGESQDPPITFPSVPLPYIKL